MGYYNMIFQYGENNFLKKCKISGVNGLIVVDLPWPENKKFANKCKKKSIFFIQLLSPTTTKNRLKKIIKDSHEMIYFISMLSTTGGKLKVPSKEILSNYDKIKKINSKKNVVIGFGITESWVLDHPFSTATHVLNVQVYLCSDPHCNSKFITL